MAHPPSMVALGYLRASRSSVLRSRARTPALVLSMLRSHQPSSASSRVPRRDHVTASRAGCKGTCTCRPRRPFPPSSSAASRPSPSGRPGPEAQRQTQA
eukprot:5329609-Heterocapsa_arctica.AAC.1